MERMTPQAVSEKILELTEQFNRYVFENPEVLDGIPEKAILVFLDAEDPEFNGASVELAHSMPHPPDAPFVYVRMKKQVRVVRQVEWKADIVSSPLVG